MESMSIQRTLCLIKPDAVEARQVGAIISRLEQEGFTIRAMKHMLLTGAEAEGFYAEHRGQPFFDDLIVFMTKGPIVAIVLEHEDAIAKYRQIIGSTDPSKAAPGTIRHMFGTSVRTNAVHGSDKAETALREIRYFFAGFETVVPS
jgi:nucleoside-diphosphate kinase